ncbi:MAG: peptide deformylase [Bacillota bacterium]|jgi:peptide deformylase|nr:peptide deformylase [Bacillota bacterium]NLV63700.1 peptide deformylase [Clostridiaceae bacterium]
MAIRQLRTKGDDVLRKKCKPVKKIDKRLQELVDDMIETMYDANGIGLAAPQVGILKRVVVIDIGEGPMVLINPEIISQSGEQVEVEGCLSIPGIWGEVKRPAQIVVKALDREGKSRKIEGTDMLARVLSHETDHLEGVLFEDKVIRFVEPDNGNSTNK